MENNSSKIEVTGFSDVTLGKNLYFFRSCLEWNREFYFRLQGINPDLANQKVEAGIEQIREQMDALVAFLAILEGEEERRNEVGINIPHPSFELNDNGILESFAAIAPLEMLEQLFSGWKTILSSIPLERQEILMKQSCGRVMNHLDLVELTNADQVELMRKEQFIQQKIDILQMEIQKRKGNKS
jgi:hypothetical protein